MVLVVYICAWWLVNMKDNTAHPVAVFPLCVGLERQAEQGGE